ncbi:MULTISPECIES: DUF4860 domain-containing protein [Kandleria]|jgi:hypothetical protein|uniref:DUF4860 domain-containing protein n=1 Tax=Kandleria vitulina DSM 20405 TaxID=1410657 RepID=A0A0R2HJ99_9FIRM|nr:MULTISPECIES: DUF4860 domain-containing protein [Kandleria]KRN49831.1 hypothetical protein IV49_GL000622 [Kandleria vitulina DSM 20405]MBP3276442.1 DUF4860 domain-containing protein [Kandleria sp.]MEE0989202.1 DUF4860 domain-containing protein [Kandleria vitulina]
MQRKSHSIDIVFVLILFSVFSLSALSIVYIGANVYGSSTKTTDNIRNFDLSMNYVVEKVKIHNNGSINIIKNNDNDILKYQLNNKKDHYMFCYQGFLCEYSADPNEAFDPQKGKHVIEMDRMSLSMHRYQLKITMIIKDHSRESFINLVRSDLE